MSKKEKNSKNGAKEGKSKATSRKKGNQSNTDLAAMAQQHRQIWSNEWKRLKDQEESVKNDVVDKLRYLSCQSLDDAAGRCLETWIDLELDATKFYDSASSSIQFFKRLVQRCRDEGISPELEAEIEAASFELNQLTEKLAQDRIDAEYEVMQAFDIPMLTSVRFTFARNVDEEFLAAHKEDSKIRRHQLGELKQLDQDFEKKLREIDKAHKTEEEPADWTTDDYQVVQHVLEQYPKSLPNRRALIMDILRRRFPHRSILDVSTYMAWCQNQVFYRSKVNSTVQDWERARIQWLREAGKAMKDEQMERQARRQPTSRKLSLERAAKVPRQRTKSEPPPVGQWKKEFADGGKKKAGSLKKIKAASGDKSKTGTKGTKASKYKPRSRSSSKQPNKTAKEKSDLSKDQTQRHALKEANLSVGRSSRGVCLLDTSFSALLNDASKTLARQRDKGPRL
ncbi:coiled-coil domain-containing protein 148-like [Varroa jacobsoni]|uniref:coiled-coil domain-containing protein 148-like n=1 Tax=Varroa jacobsoni TaxID=62625 RepID=UPI000BF416B9|nr:coiled-coil domain-containing protein 148-like [Varroa jacobsoni]XP_022709279.1 coiled-coil domain-containing protein 148-like [Varroa jacobsoni]XP_022709280.1 coiled-coil domain-containing protein 148-like [Varroa jacobsoni]XP_022709281.1 coiled-coil domain-containing protein 148-like [Varroa jacobsoni]XP_022709282.1 coiled-coil domain-containing protein 148-like [Varroa jacobsoni]